MAAEGRSELECTMDFQDVIVLDTGSGTMKVGFSGEDAPRAVLPTAIANTIADESRDDENTGGGDASNQKKSQAFYGEEAMQQATNATITRPVQRGEIQLSSPSKDELEHLWEYTFRSVLGIEQEELPVLIADTLPLSQSTYQSRQWVTEVMFEKLKVKSLAIFNTAVLSLFSTGRTRGLVVECGEGLTSAVPVFEGYAIPHAIFKMDVAGQDITSQVQQLMMNHKDGSMYAKDARVMQQLKEKVCTVDYDYAGSKDAYDSIDEELKSFELPDGKIIKVGKEIRCGAPEMLFGGHGSPDPSQSVQKICMEAYNTCDIDFQKDLIRSLVVAGGTSMLPGLAPRLRKELSSLLPGKEIDICVDSQRRYAAWIGGSMFASLSTFDQVAISKQEYEEGKADVRSLVARKTF
jgi:actin-related protein